MSTNESFLSRWSRRKLDSRNADHDATSPGPRDAAEREQAGRKAAGPEAVERAAPAPSELAPGAPSAAAPPAGSAAPVDASTPGRSESPPAGEAEDARPLELPPIASLTPQSDFRPFMQAGVDEATRNAALRQLFRDPHFNVMDGLDVYIDDYNKTEPIPPSMLAKLRQLHSIGLTDDEIESRTSAQADAAPEQPVRADAAEARAGGEAAVGNEAPPPPIDLAQAGPAPMGPPSEDTAQGSREDASPEPREDAAAEPNTQETNGEDEGSRM